MTTVVMARRLRRWAWGLSLIALAGLVVWQVTALNRAASSSDGVATAGSEMGLTLFPKQDRPQVPTLAGKTLKGEQFDLADEAGKVAVINVWGSWCGPCRAETPDLVRLAEETADYDVQFVGIDTRDNLAAANTFARKFEVPYPSIFDEGGKTLLPFADIITISAVPSTLVVDQNGQIAARVTGPVTYTTLSGIIEDLTKESQ